ncbi:MAG: sn-glycerol-3-phosphate ABC transporter ATP-binding protein UgpC [Acidiphilium sp. 37-64-53]|uniref:ABC transporter ATP-binding protein n=1 Tax=Acidiphilium sp. 37-64-53 TaxID=1970299 RepID=UPI000BC49952|nr:sn-glycerol-3-phosphate ABC transporter ATP-binding protein UgpC [Acidiphilium sp. 37-64-53]OYV69131.1 MAG: sn-glycerol-3-phosphate ABC transporter ATP-binding protein UgpC [Acidiphilium sp. 21-60-14]OZB40408.1 MAG: sn-glycerol-3-phosphate ABC transporter ATP-binding protein UgpC [Acidiphilium sp. 34-60-192]HQT89276.1 sn-glycerol-3-phosphate ABC transporter ATP-binding protein UgpC [Acidiphilium sp.]OYV99751.1 MAG: sn-glycerol-3-phosphate ABC transporter ATP-binding protein UgpC [Acidiphiliu
MARLQLEGLSKNFGKSAVLAGLDIDLADGEMLVIVGASGCGKSTLLRLVAGLETPSSGRILLDGVDITHRDPAQRDIAMVFQNYALYPHMTVCQNMAYGLKLRGLSKNLIAEKVAATAATLGLDALLGRKPRELSGGQRQRVAMGRAIVREPKLFLFDEPLSNLDAKLRVQVRADIRKLQKKLGITSLYVTHDQTEAMTLADRLIVMNHGHAAQIAPPMEIFARPADRYVATFIGDPAMNLCPATLVAGAQMAQLSGGAQVRLPGAPIAAIDGTAIILGIRPQHVTVQATDENAHGIEVMVDLVEPLGSETLIHGHLIDATPFAVRVPSSPDLLRMSQLRVCLPREHLHIFDADQGKRIGGV